MTVTIETGPNIRDSIEGVVENPHSRVLFHVAGKDVLLKDMPPDSPMSTDNGLPQRIILRSSLSPDDEDWAHISHKSYDQFPGGDRPQILASSNGFVHGILRAFEHGFHISIRPDDVWLAILTQLSSFLSAVRKPIWRMFSDEEWESEYVELELLAMSLQEVRQLLLEADMSRIVPNTREKSELYQKFLPKFSTTTATDTAVASIVAMGTLGQYRTNFHIGSTIANPRISIHGTLEDWQKIATLVLELPNLLPDMTPTLLHKILNWTCLLSPIMQNILMSVDILRRDHDEEIDRIFWLGAASISSTRHEDDEIPTQILSGWITAFCLPTQANNLVINRADASLLHGINPCVLENITYPIIALSDIPSAIMTVPVVIKDYPAVTEYSALAVAGSIGMDFEEGGGEVSIKPRSAWWLLQDDVCKMEGVEDMLAEDL